jgi:hypothetical protein
MKTSDKILMGVFLALGVLALYMGFNIDLKCAGATISDNLAAGAPLIIFGLYSLLTSLFLWKNPGVGRNFVAVAIFAFLILAAVAFFDLSIPIIKTSCISI